MCNDEGYVECCCSHHTLSEIVWLKSSDANDGSTEFRPDVKWKWECGWFDFATKKHFLEPKVRPEKSAGQNACNPKWCIGVRWSPLRSHHALRRAILPYSGKRPGEGYKAQLNRGFHRFLKLLFSPVFQTAVITGYKYWEGQTIYASF